MHHRCAVEHGRRLHTLIAGEEALQAAAEQGMSRYEAGRTGDQFATQRHRTGDGAAAEMLLRCRLGGWRRNRPVPEINGCCEDAADHESADPGDRHASKLTAPSDDRRSRANHRSEQKKTSARSQELQDNPGAHGNRERNGAAQHGHAPDMHRHRQRSTNPQHDGISKRITISELPGRRSIDIYLYPDPGRVNHGK